MIKLKTLISIEIYVRTSHWTFVGQSDGTIREIVRPNWDRANTITRLALTFSICRMTTKVGVLENFLSEENFHDLSCNLLVIRRLENFLQAHEVQIQIFEHVKNIKNSIIFECFGLFSKDSISKAAYLQSNFMRP